MPSKQTSKQTNKQTSLSGIKEVPCAVKSILDCHLGGSRCSATDFVMDPITFNENNNKAVIYYRCRFLTIYLFSYVIGYSSKKENQSLVIFAVNSPVAPN